MRLTILHTNDVHAEYGPWASCVAYMKRRRAELGAEGCLTLDSGDHLDMSVDECGLSGGRLHLELLADAGLDAFAPGNNEFCRAPRETLASLSLASPFPWLLSTVEEEDGSAFAGFRKSVIVERGGLSVGLLGALNPFSRAAEELHGLKTLDHASALEREARALRERGAGLVVLLSHCGLDEDLGLAAETKGAIDLVVGGHSHSELFEPRRVGRTIIVQAGGHGKYVGELGLKVEGGRVEVESCALREAAALAGEDAAQAAILARWRGETDRVLSEELCVLPEALPQERLLGLAAELLRRKFGADFGMIFAPAVAGSLPAGPLRLGALYGIMRSFVTPASFEISGRQVEGLLRERLDPEVTEARGFGIGFRPQGLAFGRLAFAGLDWTEGSAGASGVRVAGEPLDPERWYRAGACTHLYEAESGGYPSLDGSRNLSMTRFRYLREALAEAFRSGEAERLLSELAR
ncbi:MAG TPA: hypothetical protein PLG14_03440 [Spirochaetales bacterium]|nr:hypothetical protein [Spirochaetales bacterium]